MGRKLKLKQGELVSLVVKSRREIDRKNYQDYPSSWTGGMYSYCGKKLVGVVHASGAIEAEDYFWNADMCRTVKRLKGVKPRTSKKPVAGYHGVEKTRAGELIVGCTKLSAKQVRELIKFYRGK